MSNISTKPSVDEIVKALRQDTGELDLNPQESRLFIQTLRLLAKGEPVSPEQVAQIAATVNLSTDEAKTTLSWISERNDSGYIAGLAGLSVNDWSHKFKVNGRSLATWCAFDTLYLPAMLRQTAEVKSHDPVNEQIIQLTIGPDKVEHYAPAGAVISIVIPKVKEKGLKSAEEIWTAFCNYSLYFTSLETAQQWFKGKHVEPIFLSIEEGYKLGQKWFAQIMRYA